MGPTKKKDKTKNEKEGSRRNWQCGEFERESILVFFLLYSFFSDSQKSNRQNSSG